MAKGNNIIELSFVGEFAAARFRIATYPHLSAERNALELEIELDGRFGR
jgi:hypothetical protein